MKRKNLLAALIGIGTLGLIACNGGGKGSSRNSSVTPPADNLGFYNPKEAPNDYEETLPSELAPEDPSIFTRVDHYMVNHDFLVEARGDVRITVLGGVWNMTQKLSSFNLSVDDRSISHAVTTYESGKLPMSFDLNSCVIAYAQPTQGRFRTISSQNATAEMFAYYEDDWRAQVTDQAAFGGRDYEDVGTLKRYLDTIGKPTWYFSNYFVPDSSAITHSELTRETNDSLIYTIDFNVDSTQGTDASQYYISQMKSMVAGVGALEITIEKLQMILTIDRDSFRPISAEFNEEYAGGLAGIEGAYRVATHVENRFTILEDGMNSVEDGYMSTVFETAQVLS